MTHGKHRNFSRQDLEEALADLPEYDEMEYEEYEKNSSLSNGQNFSYPLTLTELKKWLTTPWLVGVISTILISLIVAAIAASKVQPPAAAPLSAEQQNIDTVAQNLVREKYAEMQEITKVDLNPGTVNNPGLLQQTILTAGAEIATNIEHLQNQPGPEHHKPKEIIFQKLENNATELINNHATLNPVYLVQRDRSNGKMVVTTLTQAQSSAIGLVTLMEVQAAQRPVIQPTDLTTVGLTILARQQRIKNEKVALLTATHQPEIADALNLTDLYTSNIVGATPKAEATIQDCPPTPKKEGKK